MGTSIENVLINYILLHLLASPGPSDSGQRADTMLITLENIFLPANRFGII